MNALALLLAALVAAPAESQPPPSPATPVEVEVERAGDRFEAVFTFPVAAPAWAFFRSSPAASDEQSWRSRSWKILTPGVELQRRGRYDALVATAGGPLPDKVRVSVIPFTDEVVADYVPALRLGGDSIALFDGHFSTFSVARPAVLDDQPSSPDSAVIGDYGTRVRFAGGDDLRLAGDIKGHREGNSSGTYALYGVPRATVADGVATVIDSELPEWIAGYIADFTPKVIAALHGRMGPSGITEPTILAAWEGAEKEGASMNGGALQGLILMRIDGQAALTELPALRNMVRWFIAHEAAHFWLGQAVRHDSSADSWIMEGGADLLAARTVAGLDPAYDSKQQVNDAIAECTQLAGKPIATALDRGEQRPIYACGAVFALIAERASGGDFFAFTRALIDSNRADGEVTSAEWLAALTRASGKPVLAAAIDGLLRSGSPDPSAAIAGLLKQSGIAFALNAEGVPQLT